MLFCNVCFRIGVQEVYMINYLNIQNIGIIEDITVEFFEGFNVLTGETGAGKTLIIDSLIFIGGR